MSDIDSEQEGNEDVSTEMMFIAERVQVFPAILEKSQSDADQMTMSVVIANKMQSRKSLEEVTPKRINTKPTIHFFVANHLKRLHQKE
ncbi:hypothetical protein QE152_g34934 [Popillia japonica]|uniref:Uncharacterized protein n=1 Tax=Popillia japonica TaxID=7064 RepID=A0AAW1IT30_POPJA